MQISACCSGYVGSPPNCIAYCPDGLTTEQCSNATCVFLTDPNNGTINCSLGDDEVPSYEDTCSFTCNTGYELRTGNGNRTCQNNGSWSGDKTECVRVRCPPLALNNGTITCSLGDDGVPSYEDTCSFTCFTGFELTGSDSSTCQSDGSWSGTETMCQRVPCPTLTNPNNGTLNCSLGDDEVPSYEDTCSFTCDTGYELTGEFNVTCESDGNWTGSVATCIQRRVNCTILADLQNGEINCTMNEEDPTCNFTCNIGYELTAGNAKRTCQIDGSWSGTDAVCTVVQCPQLMNGELHCPNGTSTAVFEDTCTFSCSAGYELQGSNNGTCLADKSWSEGDPKCVVLNCSTSPPLDNSQLQLPCDTQYQSTCTTVCVVGYTGGGGSYTCVVTDEGTNSVGWNGSTTCERVECPKLVKPMNGMMLCSPINPPQFFYGYTCDFTCDDGYNLIGSESRTCQSNGNWSGTVTNCTEATDDQCEVYHFQSPFHPGDSCQELYDMNPDTHDKPGYYWVLDGPRKVFCGMIYTGSSCEDIYNNNPETGDKSGYYRINDTQWTYCDMMAI
ncbi:P-selectin-like [Dysidea avara]|uniref:P-selectin-like n=1 Tax=Dysidea avara TaxID=196820 RepID=UPI003328BE7D